MILTNAKYEDSKFKLVGRDYAGTDFWWMGHLKIRGISNVFYPYLYSDSVIYAGDVSLRPDYSDSWRLRADRRAVPSGQAKFVNNEDGFFANTRKLTFTGATGFAERIIEGKINLFREIHYDPDSFDWRYRSNENVKPSVDIRNYYNKGFNDLKKVNYTNLKTDMADHAQSMDLLKTYKKSVTKRNIMYTAGGASLLAGFVSLISNFASNAKLSKRTVQNGQSPFGNEPSFLPAAIFFGAGIGFGIGGFSLHISSARNLERAVDAYNK